MKRYKVVQTPLFNPQDPHDLEMYVSDDIIDLVNIEDEDDRIMANPDDFFVGEEVGEEEIELKERMYTDDHGYHRGTFAFKNG